MAAIPRSLRGTRSQSSDVTSPALATTSFSLAGALPSGKGLLAAWLLGNIDSEALPAIALTTAEA